MTTDRTTPEGVEAWLIQASANPWTFPSVVGAELSKEILHHIYVHWRTYSSNIKLGVLFAILCIRRLLVAGLKTELSAIITSGTYDKDEWVRLISKMLLEYPNSQTLDLNIEQYIPETATKGMHELMSKIRKNGIKFYPVEYAFFDREICDVFDPFSSCPATQTAHFTLRQEISNNERQLKLTNLQVPPSPGLTSPINTNAFNFEPLQNRGQSHPSVGPPSRSNSISGPSLFIPKRRPSQINQPYPRPPIPPPQRSGSTNIPPMGAMNINPGPRSPEIKISQRKTYQKPTRIQMIDISTGSSIIKNQEETRRLTQLEEQQQKELKKQERARKAEEKRREEDEKKQQREREKAEKARQKEEAKIAKEKEKKDKAARAASVEVQASSGRKKKKLDEEEIIEEESISDGELPHKNPQVISASPSSPPSMSKSPINVDDYDNDYLSSINGGVPETNENGPEVINSGVSEFNGDTTEFNEGVSDVTSITESSRQPTIPEDVSIPSEQPMDQTEISLQLYKEYPTREMSQKDRRLFERNCSAVLSQANKIDGDPNLRQCIINFLGGVHEVKALMAVSKGVKNPEDDLRHIVLHEQTIRSPEGKAIRETFIFEMNIENGQWRKIKRRKTKGYKNKKDNEERNRMMMDEGNQIMMDEEMNQEMEERN